MNKKNYRLLKYFTIANLATVFLLVIVLELWNSNLSVPFTYEGDGISVATYFKSVIENKSMVMNRFIGYPSYYNSLEFPSSSWLHIITVRIITLFTDNYGIAMNLFYILTFIMTTSTSLGVMLKFKINPYISIVFSLLFTFLPYHFMRGENHIFLSAYYTIPLTILLVFYILQEGNLKEIFKKNKYKINIFNYKFILVLFLCILIASSGIYYAYFSCFFLVVAGFMAYFRFKDYKKIILSVLLLGLITIVTMINFIPHFIYKFNNTEKYTIAASRSPLETEVYGLKITQLLLPVSGSRIDYLREKKEVYDKEAPLVNENSTATLGIIGSIGFIISIIYIYIGQRNRFINDIGLLNLSAVLLASIGGFSTIVAFLITDMIRSYNRISIYISFLSLLLVAYLLNQLYKNNKHILWKKNIIMLLAFLVLMIGIYDQTTKVFIPNYEELKSEYSKDREYIQQIESIVGEESKIFQLPYIPYPEEASPYRMGYYDMLKPYLHSNNLYWSYGSIKGSENDIWLKEVSSKNNEELIREISLKGFNGIFIDGFGYSTEEEFHDLVYDICNLIDAEPFFSGEKRYAFIKIN